MTDPRTRVHRVVTRHLGLIDREVTDEATFAGLGADSLDATSLAMELEEEFGIDIGDDLITTTATVGEAVAAIERLIAAPAEEAEHVRQES